MYEGLGGSGAIALAAVDTNRSEDGRRKRMQSSKKLVESLKDDACMSVRDNAVATRTRLSEKCWHKLKADAQADSNADADADADLV